MVVHHAVRLIICCFTSGSSNNDTQAEQNAAMAAPAELRAIQNPGVRETFILLYVFAVTKGETAEAGLF